jgi:signal peptidase II
MPDYVLSVRKKKINGNYVLLFFIVITILGIDRITKILAIKNLFLHQSVPVIKNVFHFTLVHNYGAAFGIFQNQLFFLILVSLAAIFLIFKYLKAYSKSEKIFLMLILSGALGNLIDRVLFGYVIDFLDFRIWPVFNIADSAISIGSVCLAVVFLKSGKK